ncbi:response regulator [Cyanobacterium sp. DS4]|uniref:response regulator n=1 Tax=Cyanobacterium sp. DS4 TaxID=2878255 RepID=UPI002E80EFB0|nr:response regulator [Cyanobacterium sp. Dongsha4]WVL00294.1 response regulator [Cyanobacterium sp. Dongsha4]
MLDANSLAEIALEARNCFLEEDAPEFLQILTEGITNLKQILNESKNNQDLHGVYKELGRAAHSIKGGAGMAEMPLVSKLAHKMEDLFEALQQDRVEDLDTTLGLLVLGVEELDNLVELEKNSCLLDTHSADELIIALDDFLQALNPSDELAEIGFADDSFIKTALESDLSDCIQRVQEIIENKELATPKNVKNSIDTLLEECELLGQALNCHWLVEISQLIKQLKSDFEDDIINFTKEAIALIEKNKQQYLVETNPQLPQYSDYFQKLLLGDTQEQIEQLIIEEKPEELKPKQTVETQSKFNLEKPPLPSNNRNLRIPINKVNKMGDLTGQLLIFYEQLSLYENQIKQASFSLKKRTKLLAPLKEQLEYIYDQFSVKEKENIEQNGHKSQIDIEHLTEFDALEFDEYSQIHDTLQSLTELIIQIQEVREDFDLVNREFQETLIDMRKCLDTLDQELREVRLVPFINLAGSFVKPLEKMNKDYHKSVKLIIEGEQVLIDQNIIETLRTPFNHIIRNAFDHGIEMPDIREKEGKPNPAQIKLSAKLEGNNVILTIADDGQGIDIKKVYEKAKMLGLFPQNKEFNQLPREEILGTIFSPGFSTASQVSDLSGRGMGMDIVKAEIEKLRGTIEVKTEIGKGTIFQLKIPMALNIISLLLVKIASQTVAIPSENVLRVIRLSDYEIQDNQILWEEQKISFYHLSQILPYNTSNLSLDIGQPYAGLLLQISGEKVVMAVDAVVDEKPLVSKSLDDTVAIPPYLGGCTILGSGTVVPIFVPDYFKSLLIQRESKRQLKKIEKETLTVKTDELSIMIIDDSVAVRRTLNRTLTQVGYNVTQCRDGKEAWNTLQSTSEHFDLAICDLEMPRFDGYKVLQLIRASEAWKNLPVIILTSRDNDLHRQKAMDLGANAYLTKPFNPLKIIEKVKDVTLRF